MKSSRVGIHLLSVLLLLLWGGIMLYFYSSGRLITGEYLTSEGWFRPMVLVAGIALMVLGLFNLSTMGAEEADCCDHALDEKLEHAHDHNCGHEHHTHKEGGCCGHDHHDHDHGHSREHTHGHGHAHEHKHEHTHAHGILEESGAIGRLVAIFILAVPVSYAAIKSPDRFSAQTAVNKGVYAQNYGETASAERYTKKTIDSTKTVDKPASVDATPAPATTVATSTPVATPPAADSTTKPADAPPPAVDTAKMADPQTKGAQTKSYGSFTLADLKAQVPQNKEGSFLLEVPEIFYTAGDKEVQAVLKGQPVETIAQILPEKVNNEKGTRVRIFRLLVQCCAADARPFSIPVEFGKEAPKFKDMTWVKVTGKMNFLQENNQTIPVLEATAIVESAEPENKMIY